MPQGSKLEVDDIDAFAAIGDLENVARTVIGIDAKILVALAAQWVELTRQPVNTLDYVQRLVSTDVWRITVKEFDFG